MWQACNTIKAEGSAELAEESDSFLFQSIDTRNGCQYQPPTLEAKQTKTHSSVDTNMVVRPPPKPHQFRSSMKNNIDLIDYITDCNVVIHQSDQ